MSHEKIDPHEQRLRELRMERLRNAAARKPIPYAGKDRAAERPSEQFNIQGTTKKKGKKR